MDWSQLRRSGNVEDGRMETPQDRERLMLMMFPRYLVNAVAGQQPGLEPPIPQTPLAHAAGINDIGKYAGGNALSHILQSPFGQNYLAQLIGAR